MRQSRFTRRWLLPLAGLALAASAHAQRSPSTWEVQAAHVRPPVQQNRRCVAGPGATDAPRTVEQVVALINTLPRPVTIPCVIEALKPPLQLFATHSAASLQPSTGPKDPRFFVLSLPLLISITSDGPGADLMEFSVLRPGNQRSLKAELRFPVDAEISTALPYARLREGNGTNCGQFCHTGEARDASITHAEAFISRAIRPSAEQEVSPAELQRTLAECNTSAQRTPRCELFRSILVAGRAQRGEFPQEMPRGF